MPLVLFVALVLIGLDNATSHFIQRVDVFALLSGTLRTYQRAGCDDEVVTLKCPPGTSISIEVAQYGKSAPSKSLCGVRSTPSAISRMSYSYNVSCLWPNAIQSKWEGSEGNWGRYSLLQTVVETCQKKRQCKFQPNPKTFGGDPCPGVRKYVEVAYKCRPYEFRSKVACENERIQLKCNPNSRVAVYSASYGRTEYESIQCPQPQGVPEETCLVSYATETVMQLCHGKRTCDLTADISTFGSPCKPQSRMYLKVVYTCVPRKVLKEQYEGALEPDETEDEFSNDEDDDFDVYDAGNEFIRESAASPPAPNIEGIAKDNFTKDISDVSSKTPPHKSNGFDFENQERFFLYLIVSVAAGLLLLLSFLVGRLLLQRHRARREAKFHATNISENTLPNGFTDDISEVDADIDLTTPLPGPVPSVTIHSPPMGSIAEVVRYPHVHSHTLRRPPQAMESDMPRSLSSASSTHYYYG
ncbi:protein eva-1 homolog C isoform X5 [Anoplophora glabripennis]|uniref:protein eva-1 homolog C isoform X5 n=1 Tax=Anoplophora glabripennis TaxID=217634 RepID=UPI000874FA7C|nr:protein eva-1 homolog C isoform X5 [Anoplophora glabripennis]